MKLNFLIVALFLISFPILAQDDKPVKSIPIPAEEKKDTTETRVPKPILIKPEEKPSLTTKKENYSGIPVKNRVTMKPSEEEFSMMDKSDLIDPGKIFEDKWAKEKRKRDKEKEMYIPPELLGDQFLGDFRTKSNFVVVICRDFGEEDGDLIRVMLNDSIYVSRLELTNGYKTFNIQLENGINKVDFHALNQGAVGLNTAEFQLYDEKDILISSNNWYLPTNVNATLVLIKE
jgi:hypothetical protein